MKIEAIIPMSSAAFKEEMTKRGWDSVMLGKRWDLSTRRINQIISDQGRPGHYDDAVMALPFIIICEKQIS
ncbi:hypothetical protein [Pseudomonas sp. PLMAX]|uniref:hypothetical protein n=1 Tax=Pseudomonas sp. PLMAX TaxID=2201998 RepID=UPI0038B9A945